MNNNDIKEQLWLGTMSIVEEYIKNLKFNKSEYGVITEIKDQSKGLYEVEINKVKNDLYSMNNNTFQVGDVVIILIINNDLKSRYILGKMRM